ncbi:outer membrane lipoprotein carrier protein LolA [Nitrospinota bacterium]
MKADFEQENHLRTLGRVTKSKGRLLLDKPGRIRAEYIAPEKQLVVSNGKRFWIYTTRLNQVIVGEVKGDGSGSVPLLFLAGKGNLSREFQVELVEEGTARREGGAWVSGQPHRLSLKPLHSLAGFRQMWLEVDPESYRITGLEYIDNFGNKTRIRFLNMEEGTLLSPGLFEFEIPSGVEVLKTPSQ